MSYITMLPKLRQICFVVLTTCLLLTNHNLFAQRNDKLVLLKNVQKIKLPDTPHYSSLIRLLNEQPQIIATAQRYGVKYQDAVIATSRLSKGKLIIFGTNYYFKYPVLHDKNIQQLIENTIAWADIKNKKIQIWGDGKDLELFLRTHINNKRLIDTNGVGKNVGLLILTEDIADTTKINGIEKFICSGGTVLLGSPTMEDAAVTNNYAGLNLNILLTKAGIFNETTTILPGDNHGQLNCVAIPVYLHVNTLLKALQTPGFKPATDDVDAYATTLKLYLGANQNTTALAIQIKTLLSLDNRPPIIPTPKKPVLKSDVKYYLAYELQQYLILSQLFKRPNPGYIDPASKVFPGEVNSTAKRVNEQVVIPVHVGTQGLWEPAPVFYRWHSTGLYVAAGDKVTVTIASQYLAQHLKAQIGVHNDDLSHMDYLTRSKGDLTKTFELSEESTEISSRYGGILMINIPDTSTLKSITIQVNGAVKYPYFKLEVTDSAEWTNTIRNYPAPWAELATDKIILTVPAYRIRKLDDPAKLMKFWDEVMDADARLADISTTRVHPERIIIDQQVAYGYMYTMPNKIIGPDDESCGWMLDEKFMRDKGSWGHFHELGHRHQFWGIDFNELSEVTENLYTMYVYDQVLHLGIYQHENIISKDAVKSSVKK